MLTINLSEYHKLPFSCITRLYFILYAVGALHLSRDLYKSTLFMQNKPNFPDSRMNVTSVLTKDYVNECFCRASKTKPIKAKTKPNKAKTKPICLNAKNERKLVYNKGLWEFMYIDAGKTKPIKPNL